MAEAKSIQAVKGMNDIRPGATEAFLDTAVWQKIFAAAAAVMESFGFRRVWLPVVEPTALFQRGIGTDTDIVAKEMYSFSDRGERSLTLRPEGTAGAVRAYVEHNLARVDPIQRWWYAGPMFRAESPQKGRYRQFYQIGAELLGIADPAADAELLWMLWQLCGRLGLFEVAVRVNSVGDNDSRKAYRAVLRDYLGRHMTELCESCKARLDTNPLRVLDCKRAPCRTVVDGAPDILDAMTPAARQHFDKVLALLQALKVPFERDPRLVRGLDYYTGTTFELTTRALGAQDAILGGGRYDNLVEELGGMPTPAVGFAAGVERLALLVAAAGVPAVGPDLYLVPMAGAEVLAFLLADGIRSDGRYKVEVGAGRLKQQMKHADRTGARFALVLGEDELTSRRGKLKNLRATSVEEVALEPSALLGVLARSP
ncbi:MAG: histidine--tRNA ligase [Deltaproteobacteria bacterium]|nr:histidine--tRNA ligase [Deltaproteobacteria bacterium]